MRAMSLPSAGCLLPTAGLCLFCGPSGRRGRRSARLWTAWRGRIPRGEKPFRLEPRL